MVEYKRSPDFQRLKPKTKIGYDSVFYRVRKLNPGKVVDIRRRDILAIRDAVALSSAAAANKVTQVISTLMQFAIDREWRDANPCARIKRLKIGEYKRWPDTAIAYALTHLPEPHRRAVLLALYTGQRLGDCIAMKWADYDGTGIAVAQEKTGVRLWIPAHKVLKMALDKWRAEAPQATILVNSRSKPWGQSLSPQFCRVTGKHAALDGLCFHGLRKSAAARLAEAGCSVHEISSVTGHRTLSMVQHYTAEADQKRRARAAIGKLEVLGGGKETA